MDVRVTADPRDLVITVTDDGDGIPAEHLPRIFERFYRVDAARDREHGGAGIGLAIAKAIADAHGGSLTASSMGVRTRCHLHVGGAGRGSGGRRLERTQKGFHGVDFTLLAGLDAVGQGDRVRRLTRRDLGLGHGDGPP